MDREAAHVVAYELDLASMNPGPNRDTEEGDRGTNRPRASNRSRRPVEQGEKSIPSLLNLAAAKAVELEPHPAVMLQQQLAPGKIAKPAQMRSGLHDIGAEHRGEHALSVGGRGEDSCAREFDRFERLVPNDPRIVTGWEVVNIVDAHFARLARIAFQMQ